MTFDINKVQEYFLERSKAKAAAELNPGKTPEQSAQEDFENTGTQFFNIRSIFSLFDKNKDGEITQEEFNKVSEAEYNAFIDGLKEYNTKNNRASQNDSIWNYAKMKSFLYDHVTPGTISEDEIYFDDLESFYEGKKIEGGASSQDESTDYSGTHGLEEVFNLTDISQMSIQEILEELKSYRIEPEHNPVKLRAQLDIARRERAKHDIGSDKVDGHIGTFVQNKTGLCTVLAQIGTMSDEEIRNLFVFEDGHDFDNPMVDSNGKIYWEIKFPIDEGKNRIIRITEDEIKSGQIKLEEFGKTLTVKEFPEGDEDITAITMAFVKRFGSSIARNGEWSYITKNRFTKPEDTKYQDNQHLDLITDYKSLEGSVIGGLNMDELRRKGLEVKALKDENLDWIPNENYRNLAKYNEGIICTLPSGIKACVTKHGTFLSDGRKIEHLHAMEIRRYDETTNEFIISGSEFTNMTEVRVPAELLQFYETASLPGTPGVKETPDPGIKDEKI